MLEEGIFVNDTFVELWLNISGLAELLFHILLVVEHVVLHLIELLKLIVVLVDLILQLRQENIVSKVLGEHLIVS